MAASRFRPPRTSRPIKDHKGNETGCYSIPRVRPQAKGVGSEAVTTSSAPLHGNALLRLLTAARDRIPFYRGRGQR
jgi:hypothetical protein